MAGQRLHRTQILLEPSQHEALAQIARRESRSVSDLVREIVERELRRRDEDKEERFKRRLEALAQIEQHQIEMLAARGGVPIDLDVDVLIEDMREERSSDLAGR